MANRGPPFFSGFDSGYWSTITKAPFDLGPFDASTVFKQISIRLLRRGSSLCGSARPNDGRVTDGPIGCSTLFSTLFGSQRSTQNGCTRDRFGTSSTTACPKMIAFKRG